MKGQLRHKNSHKPDEGKDGEDGEVAGDAWMAVCLEPHNGAEQVERSGKCLAVLII